MALRGEPSHLHAATDARPVTTRRIVATCRAGSSRRSSCSMRVFPRSRRLISARISRRREHGSTMLLRSPVELWRRSLHSPNRQIDCYRRHGPKASDGGSRIRPRWARWVAPNDSGNETHNRPRTSPSGEIDSRAVSISAATRPACSGNVTPRGRYLVAPSPLG
jgi:hypothetical protein